MSEKCLGFHFRVNVLPNWFTIEQRATEKASKIRIKIKKNEDLAPKIYDLVFEGTYRFDLKEGQLLYNVLCNLVPASAYNLHLGGTNIQNVSLGHYSFGPYICFGLKNEDNLEYYDQCNKYIKGFTISPHRFLGLTYDSGTLGLGYPFFNNGDGFDFELKELHDSYEKLTFFPLEKILIQLAKQAIGEVPMSPYFNSNEDENNLPDRVRLKTIAPSEEYQMYQFSYNLKTQESIEKVAGKPGKTITEFINEYVTYKIFIKPMIANSK